LCQKSWIACTPFDYNDVFSFSSCTDLVNITSIFRFPRTKFNSGKYCLWWKEESGTISYVLNFKWGSQGPTNGQLLHDVNFDSKGNVYVSDRDRNNIQKFDPNGTFLMKWGSEGSNVGQVNVA